MSGPSSRASKGASDLALSRSRMLISELSLPEPLVPGVPPAFHIGWHHSHARRTSTQTECMRGMRRVPYYIVWGGQERSVHEAQPSSRVR